MKERAMLLMHDKIFDIKHILQVFLSWSWTIEYSGKKTCSQDFLFNGMDLKIESWIAFGYNWAYATYVFN